MKSLWSSRPLHVPDGPPAGSAPTAVLDSGDPVLERRLRDALVESRQRYKDLVEISSDFAWETRADGSFAFVSPRGALGYPAADLVDRPARDFVVSETAVPFETHRPVEEVELAFRRADGTVAILSAAAVPLLGEHGEWRGARGVCRDVTEARARDAALARARHRERLYAEIVAAIRDVVEPGHMLEAAASATLRALQTTGCRIFRYAPARGFAPAAAAGYAPESDDSASLLVSALDAPEGGVLVEGGCLVALARYRREVNGAICLTRATGPWDEEARTLATAVAAQLGIAIEQIANHEALERLSLTDPLTGLLNRRGFFDQLARRLQRLARDGRPAALIYVDLDNFKAVNDRFGHQKGDELLRFVAELLRRGTRPTDLAARLGGDEFALWLEGVDAAGARDRATLVLSLARELAPFSADIARPLGFSIGVAPHDARSGEGVEALTARADGAMYAIKHGGKGGLRIAAREPAS
jgi:diguanylate cyclase (GGDEF)-like protein/PAS domain S-box-containing protein